MAVQPEGHLRARSHRSPATGAVRGDDGYCPARSRGRRWLQRCGAGREGGGEFGVKQAAPEGGWRRGAGSTEGRRPMASEKRGVAAAVHFCRLPPAPARHPRLRRSLLQHSRLPRLQAVSPPPSRTPGPLRRRRTWYTWLWSSSRPILIRCCSACSTCTRRAADEVRPPKHSTPPGVPIA